MQLLVSLAERGNTGRQQRWSHEDRQRLGDVATSQAVLGIANYYQKLEEVGRILPWGLRRGCGLAADTWNSDFWAPEAASGSPRLIQPLYACT